MIVDVNEIERCLRYLKTVNDADFKDITWVRGDEKLKVSRTLAERFRFIGLSNRDFPGVAGWLPDGLGLRVSSMSFLKKGPK